MFCIFPFTKDVLIAAFVDEFEDEDVIVSKDFKQGTKDAGDGASVPTKHPRNEEKERTHQKSAGCVLQRDARNFTQPRTKHAYDRNARAQPHDDDSFRRISEFPRQRVSVAD